MSSFVFIHVDGMRSYGSSMEDANALFREINAACDATSGSQGFVYNPFNTFVASSLTSLGARWA